MTRREYQGGAAQLTLSSGIAASGVSSISTTGTATGWPTGSPGKFLIVIDRGLASEEKIFCDSRTGNSLSVASDADRGADGTSAASHTAGATIEHVAGAIDLDEPNAHINDTGLDHHTQYMAADGTRHDLEARHGTAVIADDAITGPKLEVSQRWEPGDLKWSARSTPSSGWLLCDGSAISRTTYADLFTAIGTTYGVGDGSTTFNIPDFQDSFVIAEGLTYTLGDTGGSADAITVSHTHTQAAHTHTQNAHNHTGSSAATTHTHADTFATSSNGSHQHDSPNQFVVTHNANPHRLKNTTLGDGDFGQQVTFTDLTDANGSHSHTVTGSVSNESAHVHGVNNDTATNQNATATNNSTGSSGTGANLPPYGVGNCFIKT